MSLEWPVDPFAGFDHSRSSLSPEVPSDDQRRDALPASTRSRWKQNSLQAPPQVRQRITGGMGLALSLPEVCGVLLGTPGVSLDLFFQTEEQRVQTQIFQESSLTTTTSYVSRRFTERMSISKLFRCWLRDLGFFVTFIPGNENAGGSAMCIHKELLREDAIVTHMIKC